MPGYLYAHASDYGPQDIPVGFGGHFDWDAVDDDEKARRGWVRDATPPAIDPNYEQIAVAFTENEDGAYTVAYTVGPGDLARARDAADKALSARRYDAEMGGIVLDGLPVPTDRETQAIVDRICKAFDDGDITGGVDFKSPLGFVPVDEATIKAIKRAGAQHVQACFSREAAIVVMIEAASDALAVRAVLDAEIGKGWPGQATDQA